MIWVEIGWVGNRAACAAVNQRSRPPGVSSKGLRVGLRRQPAELRVRSPFVVVTPPGLEHRARVRQGAEQRLVQQLVTQAPVEALIEAVLLWLAWRDVVPAHAGVVGPGQDGVEVYSVPLSLTMVSGRPRCRMTASNSRTTRAPDSEVSATSARHSRVQLSITVRMRKRRPSVIWSATTRRAARSSQVQRPALVGDQRQVQRSPRAHRSLPAAAPAHRQPFLAIDPLNPLLVDRMALAPQQDVQAAVAERRRSWARALSRSRRAPSSGRVA